MLELLWVENVAEARSEQTRRTKLWERWSEAGRATSPFGIILRPEQGTQQACPFSSWVYRPASMPDLELHVAEGTGLEEPMWCYLEASRRPADASPDRQQPLDHPSGFHEVTGVCIASPQLKETSLTVAMARTGVIAWNTGHQHLLELSFDGAHQAKRMDFRPDLPLIFRW